MNRYYHAHRWANICDIRRCETPDECRQAEAAGYEHIPVRQLRHHITWVNEENRSMGSGAPVGCLSLPEIQTSIDYWWGAY